MKTLFVILSLFSLTVSAKPDLGGMPELEVGQTRHYCKVDVDKSLGVAQEGAIALVNDGLKRDEITSHGGVSKIIKQPFQAVSDIRVYDNYSEDDGGFVVTACVTVKKL